METGIRRFVRPLTFIIILFIVAGCAERKAGETRPVVEKAFLSAPVWEDRNSEVAFYKVSCKTCGIGGETINDSFTLGSYLVKHDYNPSEETKAKEGDTSRITTFKFAIFYEYAVRYTYQAKFSYVVNFVKETLKPLKRSFVSFDWCSNAYDEITVSPDDKVSHLYRSDDYGNEKDRFIYRPNSFTMEQVPFLVRALDFTQSDEQTFYVFTPRGKYIRAVAKRGGKEKVVLPHVGEREAEKVVVAYEIPEGGKIVLSSPIGRIASREETYWRGTGEDRILLKLESGSYLMELIDHIRTRYWSHDREEFFKLMKNVMDFP